MHASNYFNLPESLNLFKDHFSEDTAPWEWVSAIKSALSVYKFPEGGYKGEIPVGLAIEGDVFIHESVKLPSYGCIQGPAYIGEDCQLRPGVYIRGNVIVGKGSVLGNSCEYKNCLLMDNVETAHFNYVGDSILGNKAHLGAGAILANVRLDRQNIKVRVGDQTVATGMRKLGAILGDGVEIGCNAVLQPGTIVCKGAMVGPTKAVGGYVKATKFFT